MMAETAEVWRLVCVFALALVSLTSSQDTKCPPERKAICSACSVADCCTSADTFKDCSSKHPTKISNQDSDQESISLWKRSLDDIMTYDDQDGVYDEEEKRAKYFLGKRANKYFLGKRPWGSVSSDSNQAYRPSLRRRAKYFLGKRSEDEDYTMEAEEEKRAKYFLGKRAKYFLGKREDEGEEKRGKYFLGKRSVDESDLDELIKRAKYFLGKRNGDKRAKYFLGKREFLKEDKRAKYFLGKRDDIEEVQDEDKRAKYFLGKRSVHTGDNELEQNA